MPVNLNPAVGKILKLMLPLALGIVILYFLYRGTDFSELWTNVKDASWGILLFSLIFGLLGNVIRGLRWQLLIQPLGYTPRKSNLVFAVLGNYAVNFALPRAGEIWRCGVVAKSEKIPFTKLIGTLIIDRMFDTIMVLLFLLVSFLLNAALFYKNSEQFNFPKFLFAPSFYIGCVAVLTSLFLLFFFFRKSYPVRRLISFLNTIWNDMKMVWKMKKKTRFLLYTLGIWCSYFFYFYITFYAFDFTNHLSIAAGLFVFTLSSISMGIPSNGGLGPWQAAVVLGLCAFAVDPNQAKAFATAVFAFQSIWVVVCGLFGIFALSVKNRDV